MLQRIGRFALLLAIIIGCKEEEIIRASGKTGEGVEDILGSHWKNFHHTDYR